MFLRDSDQGSERSDAGEMIVSEVIGIVKNVVGFGFGLRSVATLGRLGVGAGVMIGVMLVQPGWGAGEGAAFEPLPPHHRYRRTAVSSDEPDQQLYCGGGFPFSVCVVLVLRIDSPRISIRCAL